MPIKHSVTKLWAEDDQHFLTVQLDDGKFFYYNDIWEEILVTSWCEEYSVVGDRNTVHIPLGACVFTDAE